MFDGAFGTLYQAEGGVCSPCELACLEDEKHVEAIHRAYIDAGAQAIKTNTFAANSSALPGGMAQVNDVITRAYEIACRAAQDRSAIVFADIGPIFGAQAEREYRTIVGRFLDMGARHFLFETLQDFHGMESACRYIKQRCRDALIIVSFAAEADGFTGGGQSAAALLSLAEACADIDVIGLNCCLGPARMLQLLATLPRYLKPLCVMPNSGYPTTIGSRQYFPQSPTYFASQMPAIAAQAAIVGGCCGTTPSYISACAQALQSAPPQPKQTKQAEREKVWRNRLLEKLQRGERVVAVELDPPASANIERFLSGARMLSEAGVDAITVADCPIGRARADSAMLSARLRRELGIDTIAHMTCRDRNVNATKALLLGLAIEEILNVLIVTGDPIPSVQAGDVKAVFNFNSVSLMRFVRELGDDVGVPLTVSAALNVNMPNFDAELRKAKRKEEAGAAIFFTQPLFTDEALMNLRRARETLQGYILGGIAPIVSHHHACFMQSEIAGITVGDDIVSQYAGLTREQAEEVAIALSLELAKKMRQDVNGYYLMTPFGRTALVSSILRGMRESGVI